MVIGIIEDDRLLSKSLEIRLQKEGYQTKCMYTRREAKECLDGTEELLIIDIGLPNGNGIELYQDLIERIEKKIPAIFLTARDEERDMLKAFDTGADDYVVKPFSMKVLLKRIEVVLNRDGRMIDNEKWLRCGNLILNPEKKQVLLENKFECNHYGNRCEKAGVCAAAEDWAAQETETEDVVIGRNHLLSK